MIHVFTTHQAKETLSPPSGRTLLHEEVQDALLQHLPTTDRPRMKIVLNHFAAHTVPTLTPGTASHAAWREAIPQLAAHHRYVLNGILAVGCLHFSTLASVAAERDDYQDIAAKQMNFGMSQYRTEVQNITTSNAEALFAFSTMITTFVLSTAGAECKAAINLLKVTDASVEHREENVSTLVHSVCRTIRSIRGVLVILVPCYNHIRGGKLRPVLDRDWWPAPIPVTAEAIEQDQKLRHLETIWSQPGKTYEYAFDTFRSALKDLRESFALISRLRTCTFPGDGPDEATFDWGSALHWPVQLTLEFISLLEHRRMEAWVLMAHFALLPAKATTNPWLDGFATNIFTTAALVMDEEDWEWIAWPASVLGVDLDSLRGTTTTL
jgi:hypothetical protein